MKHNGEQNLLQEEDKGLYGAVGENLEMTNNQ